MRVLAVLCLSTAVLAHAGEEWDIYRKWTAMKSMESCWGEDNVKLYTVNLKQAIAKCSQIDAPELSLPPFRSPYRFLNTLLTSASEMEKRQVELAVKMLDLLKDDSEEDAFANTYLRKKTYASNPFYSALNTEDSAFGLIQKLALKKSSGYEQAESKYDEDLVEKLVEDRVRQSMMEYKLKQSLEGSSSPFSTQTNRQRLAAILEARRHKRQIPAENTKPAAVAGGGAAAAASLPESLDLGDRLAEKLKAQQERLTAKVGNFTCVLRELKVINDNNELDLELQKRALEQFSLPSEWFKRRLLDTYETCNKVAASLPAEAAAAGGEAALVPGLYKIKSFMRCCKEGKLRLCMYQDVKTKLEKNFGPLEKILAQTQLTEEQLFPLVIMLLHGEEMEYF